MASNKEKLAIFENILSEEGLDGDVIGRYAKALNILNGLKTYNELNPPQPTIPTGGQNMANQPQTPQSDTTLPPMGEGGLNDANMA